MLGSVTAEGERDIVSKLWKDSDERLLGWLKNYILSGTILVRLDLLRQFYPKMDWSKDWMGDAIIQTYG